MSIRTEIEEGIEELYGDLREEGDESMFTWKGASIECIPSNMERGLSVIVGAKEWMVSLSLYVLRTHFLSADNTLISADSTLYTADNGKPHPIAGRKLTYIGKDYRILSVTEDPSRAFYKVVLSDENSGK